MPAGPPVDVREVPFRSDRRAAVVLRARSLFGVGVRADVVCALLEAEAEGRTLTSRDLAHHGHSARAVQLALAALETAGLVRAHKGGRTYSYVLSRPGALAQLLDAEDLAWVPWHHVFPVVFHLVALATHPSPDATVQHVRAHAVARLLEPHMHQMPTLPAVPVRPGDDAAAERLLAWGVDVLDAVRSRGGPPRSAAHPPPTLPR